MDVVVVGDVAVGIAAVGAGQPIQLIVAEGLDGPYLQLLQVVRVVLLIVEIDGCGLSGLDGRDVLGTYRPSNANVSFTPFPRCIAVMAPDGWYWKPSAKIRSRGSSSTRVNRLVTGS